MFYRKNMKHVIKIQHPRNQTLITVPKKLSKVLKWDENNLGRIWINEAGNIEIEVIDLDQEKIRQSQRIGDGVNSRA
jgi:hypothetical protein